MYKCKSIKPVYHMFHCANASYKGTVELGHNTRKQAQKRNKFTCINKNV